SPGFDVVVEELFPTWLAGAAVVFSGADLFAPRELTSVVERHGVTAFELPTAYWQEWTHELVRAGERVPESVRVVLVGGERAAPERLADWARLDVPLVHVFGLTETACTSATLRLEAGEDGSRWPNLPIGAPTGNTRTYVLDAHGEPVPTGVPGELFIGGEGVARGYLGRPELTAERFVPDPFSGGPGARLYRTGDRVRWLAEGRLEFIGRMDHQVKIRGFRIETGEVEAVLTEHPAVREAFVTVREDGPGGKRLAAYVAPEAGATARADELAAYLGVRLPAYMVPSAFVVLEALPLTPNGKVDRAALPALGAGAEEEYTAPRTRTEERLAAVWSEVLGVERVGVHDDFFRLGGHSLLALRVVSRARLALGVEIPVRALFEAPTLAGLAARADALLRAGADPEAPPVVPVPREGPLPLSFAQQRLWFLDQLEPGSAAYNVPFGIRLRGPLDAEILERAVSEVVRRHEVLRTVFRSGEGGTASQVVLPPEPFALRRARAAGLAELAREEAGAPFDLAAGPLLRGTLVRLGEEDAVALFTVHHIVSDEWSAGILVREVSALYTAFAEGRPSPLAELPVQYADYAAWQRAWLTGDVLERQLAYWRERLAGAPPLLDLPVDRPRPTAASAEGATRTFTLPAELATSLRELGRAMGATPFMVLLAGFQALLARYSGEEDVSVGTPVAGRTRAETEGLIGFFVNTLVLRTDLSGGPTARELVARVRERVLEAQTHQDLPFERLVDELRVERSFSHTPLFQVMFTLESAGGELRLRLGGVEAEPLETGTGVSPFELSLVVADDGEGLGGAVEYQTALRDAATVERMLEHYRALLEGMAARPELPVAEIPLLSEPERRRVVEEWNATERAFPRDRTLHGLFAEQARRTPDAPAAVSGDAVLTYAELDAGAERLAARLRKLGAGPETRVALCVGRGLAFAVAMLGALRSGAAYVPLDPSYPAERLRWMLEDSGARVVVTQAGMEGRLPEFGGEVVVVDGEYDDANGEAAVAGCSLSPVPCPLNLAYVIYTSGSTGRPKGVAVPHRAVVNFAVDMAERLGLRGDDRFLQFASPGFDVVVEEVFPAWLSGAAVVFSGADLPSPAELTRLVANQGVTALELPTAYWHQWTHELARAGERVPESVRVVLVGGERVSPERLAEWATLGVPLVHVFGLTETACTSATLRLEAGEDGSKWPSLPVGMPTGNARLYVLDPALHPSPVGVPGELFVGGEGVARGYLGRPDLTAERFVPDPFAAENGARLYRTGDRVRQLSDGNLEFVGRIDHQAKVRGFRVEPAEIEAALAEHPEVRAAAVVVREDAPGEKRLVGYVVPAPRRPGA
ncbi:MAG TPA: amino acid adenylation domain-containing protein, partial [Longimicrobiaceae bacterium]